MRKILILFIASFFATTLMGQEESEVNQTHKWVALKFHPSFLIDISGPSLEGGIEFMLNNRWSIQQDVGYISTYDGRYWLNVDDIEGWRFRTSLRWYKDDTQQSYQAIALGYKQVSRNRTETYCREDCAFFQTIESQLITNDISCHYLLGWKSIFAKHLLVDVNVGLGLRLFKRSSDVDVPEDAFIAGFERSGIFNINTDTWFTIPSFMMTFSFGGGI